ncbi:hypothetical protein JHK84_049851 [Glycine max]|nr:hypothetical protein JHK84_049851 [Glycine max]
MSKVPLPLLLLHSVLSMNSAAMNMLLPHSSFVSLRSFWFGERLSFVKVKVKVLRWSVTAYEVRSVGCVLFWCMANRADQVDPFKEWGFHKGLGNTTLVLEKVVYILDQLRALEEEILHKIELQGLVLFCLLRKSKKKEKEPMEKPLSKSQIKKRPSMW